MATNDQIMRGQVLVNAEWWDSIQTDLRDAVAACNTITGAIVAHQHFGKYEAEELIDRIEGDIRKIRKLLEAMITPI